MHLDRRSRSLQLRRRSATAAVLLAAMVLAATVAIDVARAGDAGAACAGPSVMFAPSTVAPGQKIFVTGSGWGDDCLDVNPPPTGALGNPVDGIEIVLTQGEREWVLTSVDADDEYEFSTEVTVPSDAAVGAAQLAARQAVHGVVQPAPSAEVTITEPPPGATVPDPAVDAGETAGEELTTTAAEPAESEGESSFPTVPVAIAAVALLALVVVFILRRTSSTK